MISSRAARAARAGLVLVAAGAAACAPHPPPHTHPTDAATPVAVLRRQLRHTFDDPRFGRMLWAVAVRSLDRGEDLFELNAEALVMPASNMKIVTMAAAAEQLGWDHRFQTRVLASGPIRGGTLDGDLVVEGGGDPGLNRRDERSARTLAAWADALWAMGLRRVTGRVVGSDDAFEDEQLGAGWSWDDLAFGYAAPVGALQIDEDVAELIVSGADAPGGAARVELAPPESGLTAESRVVTGAAGSTPALSLRRLPGQTRVEVAGTVPPGARVRRTVAVDNPTLYFAALVKRALERRGIVVSGGAADLDDLAPGTIRTSEPALLVEWSAPLASLGSVLMKASQNLYAETFVKALGREASGEGSFEAGRRAALEVLSSWGIPSDAVVMADGSGLSRYNYLTASALVTILERMHRDPRHRERFMATLPVAGVDGTLADRFKGSAAEGRAVAKTGTISNVRALSGYVRTADGEWLAFSIVANHFTAQRAEVDAAAERAVSTLVAFSRASGAAQ